MASTLNLEITQLDDPTAASDPVKAREGGASGPTVSVGATMNLSYQKVSMLGEETAYQNSETLGEETPYEKTQQLGSMSKVDVFITQADNLR